MKLTLKQLQNLFPDARLDYRGQNLVGVCPRCSHEEFYISVLKNNHPCFCYRKSKCGLESNIYGVLELLGISRDFVKDLSIDTERPLSTSLHKKEVKVEESILPEIKPPVRWERAFNDPYLNERGFTEQQYKIFEAGRSRLNYDYVTILVRQDGRLTGYVSRSVKSKKYIDSYNERIKDTGQRKLLRYNNSQTDFSKMLFGLDEITSETNTVILVEGIFSKTKTDTNLMLYDTNDIKCVATFGAKMSEYQINLLKNKGVKSLLFWFEADVLDKAKKVVSEASLHFDVRASYLKGKDPGDIEEEEAIELLENSFDWLEFNTNFVSSRIK